MVSTTNVIPKLYYFNDIYLLAYYIRFACHIKGSKLPVRVYIKKANRA